MIILPRKEISPGNIRLYKSLGSIIEDYRRWRKLSQERLAESIGVSVRELQNWEADRRRARIENLHDLSEVTGIPMQICVALNADQPVWYSLRERQFAYSSAEMTQLGMNSSSAYRWQYNNEAIEKDLVKNVQITADKHVNLILSCHHDVYGAERPLVRDVIKKASMILPDMNRILFDCWGHYVGHTVCLPIKKDAYQQVRKRKVFEHYLTTEKMSDIISQHEGVFFYCSVFWTGAAISYSAIINSGRYLSKIKQKERFLIACYSPQTVGEEFYLNLGMTIIKNKRDQVRKTAEFGATMYEIKLDVLMGPHGSFGWMSEECDKNVRDEFLIERTSNCGPLIDDGPLIDYKIKNEICLNPKCTLYNKTGKGSIVFNGAYRTKEGSRVRRFLCKACNKVFCSRTGSIFYDLRSPEEKILMALKLLVKGMTLRGAAKTLRINRDTIRNWLKVAAERAEEINAMLIKEPDISEVEIDALWNFVKKGSLRQRANFLKRKQIAK